MVLSKWFVLLLAIIGLRAFVHFFIQIACIDATLAQPCSGPQGIRDAAVIEEQV